ncbi:MAG: hypothetical protein EHM41_24305 [Chloroflexi bacterium]|nr:MAG: hypothetical protein EHM41_24305 [Chloroflexota bacterium]
MFYHIKINGHLDDSWAEWFDGLTISNQEDGEALLSGLIQDQTALHGILNRISNLGLTLISLEAVQEEDQIEKKEHSSE